MPTTIKISKDMILDAAFKIAREEGIEKISNREIAKKLVDHGIKNFDFWKNLCYNNYTIEILKKAQKIFWLLKKFML